MTISRTPGGRQRLPGPSLRGEAGTTPRETPRYRILPLVLRTLSARLGAFLGSSSPGWEVPPQRGAPQPRPPPFPRGRTRRREPGREIRGLELEQGLGVR